MRHSSIFGTSSFVALSALVCAALPACSSSPSSPSSPDETVGSSAAAISADASLDPSFGDRGRMTTQDGRPFTIVSSVIRSDGRVAYSALSRIKVMVTGLFGIQMPMLEYPRWVVGRVDNAGNDDATWNGGAPHDVHADLGTTLSYPGSVLPVGQKTMAIGYGSKDGKTRSALVRLTAAGAIDKTFDSDGIVWIDAPGFTATQLTWLDQDDSGRFLVGGVAWTGGEPGATGAKASFVLGRFNASGALDKTFGKGGWNWRALSNSSASVHFGMDHDYLNDSVYVGVQSPAQVFEFLPDGTAGTWVGGHLDKGETPKTAVNIPQFPKWKPEIVGLAVGSGRVVAALNSGMGFAQIFQWSGYLENNTSYMGVYLTPELKSGATAKAITYDREAGRFVLAGDGLGFDGRPRAMVISMEPVWMHLDSTFDSDGRAATDFLTMDGEQTTAIAAYRDKIVVAVDDFANGAGLARYGVKTTANGEPCMRSATTDEWTCGTGLTCAGGSLCYRPAPDPSTPTTTPDPMPHPTDPSTEPTTGKDPSGDTSDPPEQSDPPEPCTWFRVHTNGCTDYLTGKETSYAICVDVCAKDKDEAKDQGEQAMSWQTCFGDGAGCCEAVVNIDANHCGYIPKEAPKGD
jgi:hypothetical protein